MLTYEIKQLSKEFELFNNLLSLQRFHTKIIILLLFLLEKLSLAHKFLLDIQQLAMLKKVYITDMLQLLKNNLSLAVVIFMLFQHCLDKSHLNQHNNISCYHQS
jgi:hypothetical protein